MQGTNESERKQDMLINETHCAGGRVSALDRLCPGLPCLCYIKYCFFSFLSSVIPRVPSQVSAILLVSSPLIMKFSFVFFFFSFSFRSPNYERHQERGIEQLILLPFRHSQSPDSFSQFIASSRFHETQSRIISYYGGGSS